jgi:hypothetical protein
MTTQTKPNIRNIGYCKGFTDGYENGIYNNPWENEFEIYNHLQYKIGYDAGVAEYCRDHHPEDEDDNKTKMDLTITYTSIDE